MNTSPEDTGPRLSRWIAASRSLSSYEPFLVPLLQHLGAMDCELLVQDTVLGDALPCETPTNAEIDMLNRHATLSYLWILGTYEVVRTLDDRVHKALRREKSRNRKMRLRDIRRTTLATKRSFERVRIPLAKLESARAFSETDYAIAWPSIQPEVGLVWEIAPGMFVSRRELSDELLDWLGALPPKDASPEGLDSNGRSDG